MIKNNLVKNLKKEIQDIYLKINEFDKQEQIHLIDIDLALSKVRNLYELLSSLKTGQSYDSDNQEKEISTFTKQIEKEPEPLIAETEQYQNNEPKLSKAIQEEIKTEEKEKITPEPELIIETATGEEPLVQNEIINNEETSEIDEKEENTPEIVADKFQSKKFVHDNISKKNVKKDVSAKMQSKPIKDINSAIGLNDKFIFIRELFDGDKEHYHETIQLLNNFDTFENALDFLNENFDWDEEDSNFERLKELVQRKFASK